MPRTQFFAVTFPSLEEHHFYSPSAFSDFVLAARGARFASTPCHHVLRRRQLRRSITGRRQAFAPLHPPINNTPTTTNQHYRNSGSPRSLPRSALLRIILDVTTESSVLKVLQVEDDHLWCKMIFHLFSGSKTINYLGCVSTTKHALAMCRAHAPDIVLLEVHLREGSGLDFIPGLEQLPKPPKVLLLTSMASEAVLSQLTRPNIAGMVWKNTLISESLEKALLQIAAGGRYVANDVSDALRVLRSDPHAYFKILSRREVDLLPLIGRGDSDAEIAAAFGLRSGTVKSHRHHILKKLGLQDTKKLMRWALEKGFVYPPRVSLP